MPITSSCSAYCSLDKYFWGWFAVSFRIKMPTHIANAIIKLNPTHILLHLCFIFTPHVAKRYIIQPFGIPHLVCFGPCYCSKGMRHYFSFSAWVKYISGQIKDVLWLMHTHLLYILHIWSLAAPCRLASTEYYWSIDSSASIRVLVKEESMQVHYHFPNYFSVLHNHPLQSWYMVRPDMKTAQKNFLLHDHRHMYELSLCLWHKQRLLTGSDIAFAAKSQTVNKLFSLRDEHLYCTGILNRFVWEYRLEDSFSNPLSSKYAYYYTFYALCQRDVFWRL